MERWKSDYLSVLAALYVIGAVLLTLGFVTPWWIISYKRDTYDTTYLWYMFDRETCDEAGLISGQCRYPFSSLSKSSWHLGLILRLSFYFMLAAMIFVYSNAAMILAAIFCKMYKREVFMSFLAISTGVFYPVAGLLTVMSSLFVIATYPKESGFSVFLCLIAGCFNLVCYVGLRIFDYQYTTARNKKKLAIGHKIS